MIYSLACHPDSLPSAVESVSVQVKRLTKSALRLDYGVRGTTALALPPRCSPARIDGLWRTTCFEVFFKPAGGEGYKEFNFSPSLRWAAYEFDGYRTGMRDLISAEDPEIEILRNAGSQFHLTAEPWPPELFAGEGSIALSAVIEEVDGTKSYWALAHAPGPPDFHNPACFAATLPPPARP